MLENCYNNNVRYGVVRKTFPLISILISTILIMSLTNTAYGLSCAEQSLEEDFEQVQVIFLGKVISKEYVVPLFDRGDPSSQDSKTTFSVIESFKGIQDQTVTIYTSEYLWGMNFTKGSEYVVFAFYDKDKNLKEELCRPTKLVEYSDLDTLRKIAEPNILPPLKQMKLGVNVEEIVCKEGLELIFKPSNDFPACVKPTTVEKLVERGWRIIESQRS